MGKESQPKEGERVQLQARGPTVRISLDVCHVIIYVCFYVVLEYMCDFGFNDDNR